MFKNGGKGGTNHYKKETTKFRKFEIHGGVYWKTFKLTLSKTWSLQHFHQPLSSEKCLLCLLMSAKWSVPLSSRTVRNAWSREPEHWAKITFLRMLLWENEHFLLLLWCKRQICVWVEFKVKQAFWNFLRAWLWLFFLFWESCKLQELSTFRP